MFNSYYNELKGFDSNESSFLSNDKLEEISNRISENITSEVMQHLERSMAKSDK